MTATIPVSVAMREGVVLEASVEPEGAFVVPGNDGNLLIEAENEGSGTATATFIPSGDVAGYALSDLVVSINPDTVVWIGPFPPVVFGEELGGTADADILLRGLKL